MKVDLLVLLLSDIGNYLNVKILPTDQSLHRSHLQGLEGVIHAETVFPRILGNLIKVFSDQFLLLNELYIRQGLGRKLYRLQPKRII